MTNESAWGRDIEVGASVTTLGKHGIGQPAIEGKVQRVERSRGEVVIEATHFVDRKSALGVTLRAGRSTYRRRSINHVRRTDTKESEEPS